MDDEEGPYTFQARVHYTFAGQYCSWTWVTQGHTVYSITSKVREKFHADHVDGCVIATIDVRQIEL